MAPSAAPFIRQSYSAGNCRLDLTLRPSALSQWHPKLIVEQVEFKLWMREEQGVEPVLLTEGDRTTLQAIAHYIEHRTQAVLTVNRASSVTAAPPQLPAQTQIPHTLSYLQLCDLSSVLTQCKQAAKTLPVSLAPSTSVETAHPVAARGQQIASIPPQPAAAPKQKGKLIFFPTGRRAAWASSAAAALFAVGLTAALWQNKTSVPETASIAEADLAEPNIAASENKRLRLGKSTNPEPSATLPNNASQSERSQTQTAQKPDATTQRAEQPTDVPEQSNSSTNRSSRDRPPAASSSATNPPAGSAPSAAPVSPKNSTNESANAPTDISIATAPAPASRRAPNNPPERETVSAEPDAEAPNPAALSAPTDEAELPSLAAPSPQASVRRGQSNEVNRASAPPSPTAATVRQESETITQVRNYFINQWRPNDNLSAPLSYQLQLSPLGEVVSFSALTEGGGAYRDRLLPNSTLSFLPSNSAALVDGLTLKITLTPSGQVQVEKI